MCSSDLRHHRQGSSPRVHEPGRAAGQLNAASGSAAEIQAAAARILRLEAIHCPAISDLDIPLGQRKSFMELAPGDCRWGVGDVGSPGFFFCGAPQAPGLPYCHAHRARAYNGKGRVFRPRDFIFKHSRLQILREDAA